MEVMLASVTSLSDFSLWARTDGLEIVMLVTGAFLVSRAATSISRFMTGRIDRQIPATDELVRSQVAKHRHAVTSVVTGALQVVLYVVVAVLVLERFGVPLATLVAPAAALGVGLGFGAQTLVQDLLAGFFIVSERQYGYGDIVEIKTVVGTAVVTGTVEEVTLRVTRLRTVNGEVVFVPNGQILLTTNLSRDWARAVIDVPVPATADVSTVTKVLREVGQAAFADETLRPLLLDVPSVMGIESISVDQFEVRVVARTLPGKQFQVGRTLREHISIALREAGIISAGVSIETGS
ncbi:MAG: mechanosensitive ion channel family protein [Acidimicrobiales bacterium]|jgi:small conductance mechanosensitive channel